MSTPRRTRAPLVLVPFAFLGVAFVVVPLAALFQRAPWSSLGELITEPVVTEALRLSVVSAVAATVISLVLGVPLALSLIHI